MKNRLMLRIFDYATHKPVPVNWSELYDLTFLAIPVSGRDVASLLEDSIPRVMWNGFAPEWKRFSRVSMGNNEKRFWIES